ncbi:MAG: hypothetical protein KDA41_01315 [Planctomycetales bacterium]|nr:hypothetical protein [Planctomycetales bacterium]
MEARLLRAALSAVALFCLSTSAVDAAGYRTTNFVVTAATPQIAQAIGDLAEQYRRDLAIEWLGHELPQWSQPCPITAQVSPQLGAGGATSFMFDRGQPFGWRMSIQGSYERVLDSVLPHEVTHTIFATHFGQPLPRWADEGACTTVEHESETTKQHHNLIRFLQTQRGIPFNKMFQMREYPPDVLPLYAQGYSVTRYLIAQGGKRRFVDYVGEGLRTNNWPQATQQFYGYRDLSELQVKWVAWVAAGSAPLDPHRNSPALVADASPTAAPLATAAANTAVVRGQEDAESLEASPSQVASAAQVSPDGGWQSRDRAAGPRLASRTPEGAVQQSVTRPQPPQRPEQTVVEPSRIGGAAAVARPAPIPGRSYYDRSGGAATGRLIR